MHIKVSGEDLRAINKTSIALPDENDMYWGTLSVNHEIHCLVSESHILALHLRT